MDKILLSPPAAMLAFFLLVYGIYRLGGMLQAAGENDPDKYLPYTGGERPLPIPNLLNYHSFFRLALLFGILHVATLVLSTLPRNVRSRRTALAYAVGIAISVFVLVEEEEEEEIGGDL
jgi:NADH:ubiquinone oxidoreductase subunit 3 (subunit A)